MVDLLSADRLMLAVGAGFPQGPPVRLDDGRLPPPADPADYGTGLAAIRDAAADRANVAGTAEVAAERLGRYVAEGARHLVIRIAALDIGAQLAQLDRPVALRPELDAARARRGR